MYKKEGKTAICPETFTFRKPVVIDGSGMWELAKATGVLDLNSVYSYLMLCKYFPETCVVAKTENNKFAGFVTGFCTPEPPLTVFVWQVAVDAAFRGRGLALSMLKELLQRDACSGAKYLETTITPSNEPSRALFTRLAKDTGAPVTVSPCFPETLFPRGGHEAELLFRIGPFSNIR